MKFSRLGLLTLLISLFILSGCKNQDGIGLGVDAGSQLNGSLLLDTNIIVTTVPEDTVSTSALFRTPLAFFKDPELGITEANIAAAISLPAASAYTLPTGTITIDSALLVLPYAPGDGFYGDSLTSRYKVDVHQLNEQVLSTRAYYNNKAWNFNPALLGTRTFTARSHDTLRIFSILKGRADTLIKVSPQVRIPISADFINTYLLGTSATAYRASNAAFQNAVKGLYLNLDKSLSTGPGGHLMFSVDSARINVYYRANNSGTIDTAVITLPVQAGAHAAQIKHTYSAKVQAALNNPNNGLFYLQGAAGLRAKVSFPNIKNVFAGLGSNVVINRAEIIVNAAPGTIIPYRPAARLTMYQLDLARQRVRLQDASASDPRGVNADLNFGGFYNKSNNEYHFTVTAYIQDLISGRSIDYGTYIAPVNPVVSSVIDITPAANYAERTIATGKGSASRIRLNIIYTKINK